MENQVVDKTSTWVIKNFLSIKADIVYSDRFLIDGCTWRVLAYPKGDKANNYLSLFLSVHNGKALARGWRRDTKFSFTVVNQRFEGQSCRRDGRRCFTPEKYVFGFAFMLPLSKIYAKDSGFLVNGELKIVVEVNVVEVSGDIYALQEYEEPKQLVKRIKREDSSSSSVRKSIDINGFQVCSSQAELVNHIFRKHPDIGEGFLFDDQEMKAASMNVLISLINTLCKSLEELNDKNLMEANTALSMVKSSGFKVDWLEAKLEEVKAKKKEQQKSVDRMQELEGILEIHKKRCEEIEALLEMEKAKVLASKGTSQTFDDVV